MLRPFIVKVSVLGYFPLLLKNSHSAGFEPARAEPNRFLVYRLNRSATSAYINL